MVMIRKRSWMSWNSDLTERNDLRGRKNHLTRDGWCWTLPHFRTFLACPIYQTAGRLHWYSSHPVWGIHFFIEITCVKLGWSIISDNATQTKFKWRKRKRDFNKSTTIPKVKRIMPHRSLVQWAEQMSRFAFWLRPMSEPGSLAHSSY